jgi:hypothetical protein
MLYDIKAIIIIAVRIRIFLKNRFLRTLFLAISVNSLLFTGPPARLCLHFRYMV